MANDTIRGAGDVYEKDLYGDLSKSAKEVLPLLESINKALQSTVKANTKLVNIEPKDISSLNQISEGVENTNKVFNEKLKLDKKISIAQKQAQKDRLAELKLQKDREKAFDRADKQEKNAIKNAQKLRKATVDNANAFKILTKQTNIAQARFKRLAAQYGETDSRTKKALVTFNRLDTRLRSINNTARDGRRDVGRYGLAFNKLGSKLKGGLGFLGLASAATIFAGALRGAGETISQFDEGVADLAKVTGLAKEDARLLAEELLKIDTRTSVNEILALATAGGRLGLEGRALIEFTESADKAFVALSDSLDGSAEEIAVSLGKVSSVFGLDEEFGISQSIDKIGSSLNDLGAKSKASEGNIQDFTNRVGGIASQANLALPEVQALGALFDEAGQSIEVSASTINKLLPAIGKNISRFAKVSGQDIESFEKLVAEKPLEALKAVAKGAKSSTEGLQGLSKTLENYGISSARSAGIVGILSSKTERLTELQGIANEAFEDGTSLSEEFAIKNETLTARIERLTNKYDKFILSVENGEGVLSDVFGALINNLSGLLDDFTNIGKSINTLIDGATSLEEKFKIVFNGITDVVNNSVILALRKVAEGIDAITGSNLAESFEIPQFQLISDRVNALTGEFKKLSQEQIHNRDVAKGIITEYVKAGLTTLQAVKEYKKLRIELGSSTKEIGSNTDATDGNTESKKKNADATRDLTGLIEKQEKVVSDLNKQIKEAATEEDILGLSIKADVAKDELDRLKRIVSSSIEEFDKIQLGLIDDQTERVIAKEKEKNDKLIELIRSNSKVKGTVEERLTLEQAEAIDKIEANQAAFRLNEEIKRDKKKIELQSSLSKAEFEQRRSGFKTEAEFEKEKAEQLRAIRLKAIDEELDLLKDAGREKDKLKIEQLKAERASLFEFEEETQKDFREIQLASLNLIERSVAERSARRLEQIDKDLSASEKVQDQLRESSAKDVLDSDKSLASEQKKQAELERQAQQEARKQELRTAGFKILSALLEQGKSPQEAIPEVGVLLGALPAVIDSIPTFYQGTNTTVADALGSPHLNTSRDGYVIRADGSEKILNPNQSARTGGMTTDQITSVAESYNKGMLGDLHNYNQPSIDVSSNNNWQSNQQVISRFESLERSNEVNLKRIEKAINDKPALDDVKYDRLLKEMVYYVSDRGTKKKVRSKSTGSSRSIFD